LLYKKGDKQYQLSETGVLPLGRFKKLYPELPFLTTCRTPCLGISDA